MAAIPPSTSHHMALDLVPSTRLPPSLSSLPNSIIGLIGSFCRINIYCLLNSVNREFKQTLDNHVTWLNQFDIKIKPKENVKPARQLFVDRLQEFYDLLEVPEECMAHFLSTRPNIKNGAASKIRNVLIPYFDHFTDCATWAIKQEAALEVGRVWTCFAQAQLQKRVGAWVPSQYPTRPNMIGALFYITHLSLCVPQIENVYKIHFGRIRTEIRRIRERGVVRIIDILPCLIPIFTRARELGAEPIPQNYYIYSQKTVVSSEQNPLEIVFQITEFIKDKLLPEESSSSKVRK